MSNRAAVDAAYAVPLATALRSIAENNARVWNTYNAKTRQFSGVPVEGEHELSVHVTDARGGTATGVLSFNVVPRVSQ